MQPCWRALELLARGWVKRKYRVDKTSSEYCWCLFIPVLGVLVIALGSSIPALLLPCTSGTAKPVVLYSKGIIDRTLSNPCYPLLTIFSHCQSAGCRLVCLGGSYEILPFVRWRTKTTWCKAEGFESRANCFILSRIVHLGRYCTSCIVPGDFLIQFSGRLSEEQLRTYQMDSVCSKLKWATSIRWIAGAFCPSTRLT